MLVEEAGQVLEAHILGSLVPSVQHMILIGDPLQLRPSINNYGTSTIYRSMVYTHLILSAIRGAQEREQAVQVRHVVDGASVQLGVPDVADRRSATNEARYRRFGQVRH